MHAELQSADSSLFHQCNANACAFRRARKSALYVRIIPPMIISPNYVATNRFLSLRRWQPVNGRSIDNTEGEGWHVFWEHFVNDNPKLEEEIIRRIVNFGHNKKQSPHIYIRYVL